METQNKGKAHWKIRSPAIPRQFRARDHGLHVAVVARGGAARRRVTRGTVPMRLVENLLREIHENPSIYHFVWKLCDMQIRSIRYLVLDVRHRPEHRVNLRPGRDGLAHAVDAAL